MANLTVTAASVRPVEMLEKVTLPAGEAISAGMVAKEGSGGTVLMTNDGETPTKFGIALGSVAANFPVTVVYKGLIYLGDALDSLDPGAIVYMSATDGLLGDAAAANSTVVGVVESIPADTTPLKALRLL